MNRNVIAPLTLALGIAASPVLAQTTPTSPAAPGATPQSRGRATMMRPPAPNPARALQLAYRVIGDAEARGANGKYLDAARSHYKSAIARMGRNETLPAAAEALAAAALARASVLEKAAPLPRDIPTPPAVSQTPNTGRPAPGRPGPGPGMMMHRPPAFNAARLADLAKTAATPEASDLAKAALDADLAGERAAFAGNREDGTRQHRLAMDLAVAVGAIAHAEHPDAFQSQHRRMWGPGFMGPRPQMGPGGAGRRGPMAMDDDMGPPPPPPMDLMGPIGFAPGEPDDEEAD